MPIIRDDLRGKLNFKNRQAISAGAPHRTTPQQVAASLRQGTPPPVVYRGGGDWRIPKPGPGLDLHQVDVGVGLLTGLQPSAVAHGLGQWRHPLARIAALQRQTTGVMGGAAIVPGGGGGKRFSPETQNLFDAGAMQMKNGQMPAEQVSQMFGIHQGDLEAHAAGAFAQTEKEMYSNIDPQAAQMSPRYRVNQLTDLLARVKETQQQAAQKAMQPRPKINANYLVPKAMIEKFPLKGVDQTQVPWPDFSIKPPRTSRDNVPLEAFPKPPLVEHYYEPGQLSDQLRTLREDPKHTGPIPDPERGLDFLQTRLNQRWQMLRQMDADHATSFGRLDDPSTVARRAERERLYGPPLPQRVRDASSHLQGLARSMEYGQARANPHRILDPEVLWPINQKHALNSVDTLIAALKNHAVSTPRVKYPQTRGGRQWSSIDHDKLLQLYEHFGIDPEGFIPKRRPR